MGPKVPQNSGSQIDASHSRQPLVKGERLVRYEVNAVRMITIIIMIIITIIIIFCILVIIITIIIIMAIIVTMIIIIIIIIVVVGAFPSQLLL